MAVTKYPTHVLKAGIDELAQRTSCLEKNDIKQDERISELRKDVDENMTITKELQKVVILSGQAINFGKWLLGIFGVSVIALIWSLITGQATLLFK